MGIFGINTNFPTISFTIILKGKTEAENDDFNKIKVKKDLQELIKAGLSLSAASKYLAKKNGIKKSEVYNLN